MNCIPSLNQGILNKDEIKEAFPARLQIELGVKGKETGEITRNRNESSILSNYCKQLIENGITAPIN